MMDFTENENATIIICNYSNYATVTYNTYN